MALKGNGLVQQVHARMLVALGLAARDVEEASAAANGWRAQSALRGAERELIAELVPA